MNKNPWTLLNESQKKQQRQLLMDMLPYYQKIAVYDADKSFIQEHLEACIRIAHAGECVMKNHPDVKPEEAIFSDDLFRTYVSEAWNSCFDDEDKIFLNEYLAEAAECFRMGFMMADLPQIN